MTELRPAQCYSCWSLTCVDDGVNEIDRTCPSCKKALASLETPEPSDAPAIHSKVDWARIEREVNAGVRERLMKRARQHVANEGDRVMAQDREVVEERRKAAEEVRRSGKQGDIRQAATIPTRWLKEKQLLTKGAMSDPGRLKHELKKAGLWYGSR